MFIRPTFDKPKSVSLMCPIKVTSKLKGFNMTQYRDNTLTHRKNISNQMKRLNQTGGRCSRWFEALTCLVSGLGERCHNYGGIPKQGQSLQSTFWPCRLAKDPCSSTKWHSPHLPRGHTVYLHGTLTHRSDRSMLFCSDQEEDTFETIKTSNGKN